MTNMRVHKFVVFLSLFPLLIIILVASAIAKDNLETEKISLKWDRQTNSLVLDQTEIHIGIDVACGCYTNYAQYASFGLEIQLFKFSKIVIPVVINHNNFFSYIDFAVFYDSIKSEIPANKHLPDPNQGYNKYINFDWYKNLGTRNYYLGNMPLVEVYAGYQFSYNNGIIIGRIKNQVGLTDNETPWKDDGLFSPMSYWLSRDLYSGVAYYLKTNYFILKLAVLSGNNPMKGYANYLDHIQSPNLKANNTLNLAGNLDINLGYLLNLANKSKLTLGILKNALSSTWNDKLQDGKRNNHVAAVGVIIDLPLNNNCSAKLLAQYTWYLSGLSELSNQNNKIKKFKDIIQSGYFAGITLNYKQLTIAYTHEYFDRFDSNIYSLFLDNKFSNTTTNTLKQLEALKQSSDIIKIKYKLYNYTFIEFNFHYIHNPLKWTSYIINNHEDYRFGISVNFIF